LNSGLMSRTSNSVEIIDVDDQGSDDNDDDQEGHDEKQAVRDKFNGEPTTNTAPEPDESDPPRVFAPMYLFATVRDLEERRLRDDDRNHWCFTQCKTLRELVGLHDVFDPLQGPSLKSQLAASPAVKMDWIVISTYLLHVPSLLSFLPELLSVRLIVLFYGHEMEDDQQLPESTSDNVSIEGMTLRKWRDRVVKINGGVFDVRQLSPSYSPCRSAVNPTPYVIPYGVHHSKFFIVGYRGDHEESRRRIRVVIHTSNLIFNDIMLKTQGAYAKDFYEFMVDEGKSTLRTQTDDTPRSEFGETLISYLDSYGYDCRRNWRSPQPGSLKGPIEHDGETSTILNRAGVGSATETQQPTVLALDRGKTSVVYESPAAANPYKRQRRACTSPLRMDQSDAPVVAGHSNLAGSFKADDISPCTLTSHLRCYDFRPAQAVLIASIPGYHRVREVGPSSSFPEIRDGGIPVWGSEPAPIPVYGHLALRNAIARYVKSPVRAGSVVCQFSSLGSLSASYLENELRLSMDVSKIIPSTAISSLADGISQHEEPPEVHTKKETQQKRPGRTRKREVALSNSAFRLVYPTVREIFNSIEGVDGGSSVPGTMVNVGKPFLRKMLCRWSSDDPLSDRLNQLNRSYTVPHIKTYFQTAFRPTDPTSTQTNSLIWLVLSSHNLSKAAWGSIEQPSRFGGSRRLFVRHWELGVFFSPQLLDCDSMLPFSEVSDALVPERSNQEARTFDTQSLPGFSQSGISADRQLQTTITQRVATVPIPYSVIPSLYTSDDEPWAVDRRS
jgi:Tyrosyl-DNA phosphodiesterase